jgi:hypothetical protein
MKKVTINIFIPITLIFILFLTNYLSFSCVCFFFILALFRPPGSGSMWIRIRIRNTAENQLLGLINSNYDQRL